MAILFYYMKGILDSEVYTPKNIVDRLISYAGIHTGRSVCDPACGTGNILAGVIDYLKRNKFTDQEIADNMETEVSANVLQSAKTHALL